MELVAGSAWMMPPVVGLLLLVSAEVAAEEPDAPGAVLACWFTGCCWFRLVAGFTAPGWPGVPPIWADRLASAATIARSVTANLVASAFLRGTTHILPLLAVGTSRRATKTRIWRIRSALAPRIKIELLRGSAKIIVLSDGSAPPVEAVSRTLLRMVAISVAMA